MHSYYNKISLSQVNSEKRVQMEYYHGYEEDSFLKSLRVEPKDVEFLADNCTKVSLL
jgi:hypothetical protein